MAKNKTPVRKKSLMLGAAGLLIIIALATAIYAITTWQPTISHPTSKHDNSQLPDQSHMPDSLQAQPASNGIGTSASSEQLQSTSTASPQATSPAYSDPCGPPGSERLCQ